MEFERGQMELSTQVTNRELKGWRVFIAKARLTRVANCFGDLAFEGGAHDGLKLPAAVHFLDDVAATNELAIHIDLRNSRPV